MRLVAALRPALAKIGPVFASEPELRWLETQRAIRAPSGQSTLNHWIRLVDNGALRAALTAPFARGRQPVLQANIRFVGERHGIFQARL